MKVATVWEVLTRFKDTCRFRGWKTSENDDWIQVNDTYHSFLWTKDVHHSSFRRIALNGKCVIREGLSYRIVKPSYTAWLFSKAPSGALLRTVLESPDFSEKIALYDLSPFLEGKDLCVKLNRTDSPVFQEFERFLRNELNVKLRTISTDSKLNTDSFTVAELV